MKTIEISGSIRTDLGKKSTKKLRAEGKIPCVMYGGEDVVHFSIAENKVKKIVYTADVYLIDLDLEGKKYQAVLKDLQFHPVNDKPLHIDFVQVIENKPVQVFLPVQLTGNSVGLRNGGKLRLNKRYLKVSGEINQIPENLKIDITKLDIGNVIKVEDLKFDSLDLLDTEKDLVVGIITSRLAAKGMGEEELEEGDEETSEETEEASKE